MRRAATVLMGAALAALAAALVWVHGMRRKDSAVVELQRRINRAVLNPRELRRAGGPGAATGVLRHVGRRSGTPYETPLGLVPTDDGFVVALVYGRRSDWARNVLASGSAVVVHDGRTVPVDRPEVVPVSAVAEYFTAEDRRGQQMFAITEALRLRRAEG